MHTIQVARQAMHTRFEVVVRGDDPVALRAAADAALNEIELLDGQLSLFRPTSEISRINRSAATEPVRVSPPVFQLLELARQLSQTADGAFDPTVAPLLRAWGFLGADGEMATPGAVAAARQAVGMRHVDLDAERFTVRFTRPGMMIDLGAIGKGYAIDCAVAVLREAGVRHAFLHGGTSSCFGLGAPAGAPAWKTAINDPRPETSPGTRPPLATVPLSGQSLGVSAIHGKSFSVGGRTYGHVIDPRSGEPVQCALLAAAVLPSATESDALSTALITLGAAGLPRLRQARPEGRFLVMEPPTADSEGGLHDSGLPAGG